MTGAKTDVRGLTVSEGTLRSADLKEAFASMLEALEPGRAQEIALGVRHEAYQEQMPDESLIVETIADELAEALEEHAPDGYRFGAHDDDGACFGFWPIEYDDPDDFPADCLDC